MPYDDDVDAKIESLKEYVDEQITKVDQDLVRDISALRADVNGMIDFAVNKIKKDYDSLENKVNKFNKRLLYVSLPAFILIVLSFIF